MDGLIRDGRYASAEEVVREGLRLVEAREVKLQELRATLNEAIAKGGSYASEDVMAAVKARLDAQADAALALNDRRPREPRLDRRLHL